MAYAQLGMNAWNYYRRRMGNYTAPIGYSPPNATFVKRRRKVKFKRSRVPRKFKKNLLALKESKFKDLSATTLSPVNATSTVTYLDTIAQGDTDGTRDGDTIYITSFQMKGTITGDVDQTRDRVFRLLLVKMIDVRGTILSVTDLFDTDAMNSLRKVDNSKNFKILKTFTRIIKVPDTVTNRHISKLDWYYKFKTPLRCKFLLTTAVVGAADRNHLFLVAMTDGGATDSPVLSFQSRLTFKDV